MQINIQGLYLVGYYNVILHVEDDFLLKIQGLCLERRYNVISDVEDEFQNHMAFQKWCMKPKIPKKKSFTNNKTDADVDP
jgi:hypothetical protein